MPLNTLALSTLPRHILTQGTAIRSLMRNLGGSIGISVLVANLGREHADRAFAAGRESAARQSADPGAVSAAAVGLHTLNGLAQLNKEVTRQAAMVAYTLDFQLMMVVALLSLPLLLLIRDPKRRPPPPRIAPAAAPAGAND